MAGFGFITDMILRVKQNQELRKNATRSRLSRQPVHYKKSNKKLVMSPKDKAKQKALMKDHRDFIKRRDTITIIVSIITLGIIIALMIIFVF